MIYIRNWFSIYWFNVLAFAHIFNEPFSKQQVVMLVLADVGVRYETDIDQQCDTDKWIVRRKLICLLENWTMQSKCTIHIYSIRYSDVSHRIVNKDGFVTSCDHIKLSRVNVNDIYTSVLFHHPIYTIQTKNKQRPCIVLYTGFLFKWWDG